MKKSIISGAILASALVICACSGGKTETSAEAESSAKKERAINYGIEYIYDSPEAATAPEYIAGIEITGPLALLEPYVYANNPVDIVDEAMWEYNKRKLAKPMLANLTQDTIEIESVKLPDSRFDAEFGSKKMIPGMFSALELYADTTYTIKDYRVIITYRDKKYPDQTFHINIYPNRDALNAAKAK